jgi:hypothetical protein
MIASTKHNTDGAFHRAAPFVQVGDKSNERAIRLLE